MNYPTVKDVDFKGKKVLVRTGFDLPVDEEGNILDDKRIKISLPTIQYLLDHEASQIILMCHMDRPKGKVVEKLKTDKTAKKLCELLKMDVTKVDGWSDIPNSKIVLLENLRFNLAETSKDKAERDAFGKELAALADIYVQDAFSNCHRDHASMTSVPELLPGCAGLSVEKEISLIEQVKNPDHPVVVLMGGIKADKLNSLPRMLSKADKILVGGALALLIKQGISSSTKIDKEDIESITKLIETLKDNPKIILPSDVVIADSFSEDAATEIVSIEKIKEGWMVLDLGPETIASYKQELEKAKTILWFGPLGVFEMEKFSKGTKEIAQTLANSSAVTIIGGGDSASAVNSLGFADKMSLVSTGGGASLKLYTTGTLIAIEALKK